MPAEKVGKAKGDLLVRRKRGGQEKGLPPLSLSRSLRANCMGRRKEACLLLVFLQGGFMWKRKGGKHLPSNISSLSLSLSPANTEGVKWGEDGGRRRREETSRDGRERGGETVPRERISRTPVTG